MLGGAYAFDVAKAFASYGQAKADNTSNKAKTLQLGGSVPVFSTGKVLASWAKTERSS